MQHNADVGLFTRPSIVKMLINIPGQNFCCGSWGTNGQVMIYYGMNHLMGQNTFMYVMGIDVYCVVFENVP